MLAVRKGFLEWSLLSWIVLGMGCVQQEVATPGLQQEAPRSTVLQPVEDLKAVANSVTESATETGQRLVEAVGMTADEISRTMREGTEQTLDDVSSIAEETRTSGPGRTE